MLQEYLVELQLDFQIFGGDQGESQWFKIPRVTLMTKKEFIDRKLME
jgi:hypothetical protein